MSWTIREPWQKEWERYRELLRDANLPLEGVGPGKGGLFLVAVDSAGRVAGGVGLDGMGPELLLRSLVVAPAERGSGLGRALLAAVEEMARDSGAESLFLLTETAARFFAGRGFLDLSREQALAAYRRCDVVVRSIRLESYGLSRVEAICQGTPVVATNTGETRGMLCYEFGDIDGLARQLEAALTEQARDNTKYWARLYSKEAAQNRQRLLALLEEAGGR